jgi:hypothetical protein
MGRGAWGMGHRAWGRREPPRGAWGREPPRAAAGLLTPSPPLHAQEASLNPGGLSGGFRTKEGKVVEAGMKGFWYE